LALGVTHTVIRRGGGGTLELDLVWEGKGGVRIRGKVWGLKDYRPSPYVGAPRRVRYHILGRIFTGGGRRLEQALI